MLSPCCQSETKCTDSRNVKSGRWRRYECLKCKERFSTEEKVIKSKARKPKPVAVKQAAPVRNERRKPMTMDELKALWARTG